MLKGFHLEVSEMQQSNRQLLDLKVHKDYEIEHIYILFYEILESDLFLCMICLCLKCLGFIHFDAFFWIFHVKTRTVYCLYFLYNIPSSHK